MLRSKRKKITVPKPKEVSQAQKKISQVQGSRCKGTTKEKEMIGPRGLKPKRRSIKKEKKPTARD